MEKLISILIWLISSALGKTWRINVVSPPSVDIFDAGAAPKVYCFWHSALLVISYLFRNTGKTAVVSRSRDGRIAAGVARLWGHGVAFGSSGRGGASALRQSLRALREGRSLGITPDGPRGPKEVVKPGAAQIAIAGGAPAVTIKINADRAWRLKSWDGFIIPGPFSKITVTLSGPIAPPARHRGAGSVNPNTGGDSVSALTRSIQESLSL
ncbi:MAG: lysophospholipid acyltransferase family protein [Chitinispirillia bacterium]|nr:lysophospholipid acyltransferase family protein [Chitinispirillia bacterium]MCL2269593.1 lysophospholipid acyltransferase family protein [Chitinispirillia bacterium]